MSEPQWTKTPPTEDSVYFVILAEHTQPMVAELLTTQWLGHKSRRWSIAGVGGEHADDAFDWFWPEPIEFPPLPQQEPV